MKYCKNCGSPMDDYASVCTSCGVAVQPVAPQPQPVRQPASTGNASMDVGLLIISFLFPTIGMFLCCSNIAKNPMKAQSAGTGATIRTLLRMVVVTFGIIISAIVTGGAIFEIFEDIGYYL